METQIPKVLDIKKKKLEHNVIELFKGRNQRIHGGSYIVIPQDDRLNTTSFTLQAYIFPTTPEKGKQGILTKWNEKTKSGYGLFIDENSCLSVMIGDGGGQVMKTYQAKKN